MKELTIELLAPYLPYDLQVHHTEWESLLVMNATGEGNNNMSIMDVPEYCKPVLRPLSDLIKAINVNGEIFPPMRELKQGGTNLNTYRIRENPNGTFEISACDNEEHETVYHSGLMSFFQMYKGETREYRRQFESFQKLFKWHFDVFGLIPRSLAISIHEIKLEK